MVDGLLLGNNIGKKGALAISEALKYNNTLTELEMKCNETDHNRRNEKNRFMKE